MAAPSPIKLEVPTDFGFTEEHALLRAEARRFLSERLPMKELRKLADAGVGFDRALWKELAAARLGRPRASRGAGRRGTRLAAPRDRDRGDGPAPGARSVPRLAARRRRDRRSRKRRPARAAAARRSRPATAWRRSRSAKPAASSSPDGVTATAEFANGVYVLRGQKTHVLCGADADLVVAPFREASGEIVLLAVELPAKGVSIEAEVGIDPTRPMARISFDGVHVPAASRLDGDAAAAWHAMLVRGFAALAAEQVGGAESVLLETRDYADRAQAVRSPDRLLPGREASDRRHDVRHRAGAQPGGRCGSRARSPTGGRGDAGAHGEGAGRATSTATRCARACSSTAATASPGIATSTSSSAARCGAARCSATASTIAAGSRSVSSRADALWTPSCSVHSRVRSRLHVNHGAGGGIRRRKGDPR